MNKSYKFISAPCAIIIGLDSMQGLQTARILAKRGVPVVSIAKDPKYMLAEPGFAKILFMQIPKIMI